MIAWAMTITAAALSVQLGCVQSWLGRKHKNNGGHMFMAGPEEIPINNRAVLNISQIIFWIFHQHVQMGEFIGDQQ